MKKSFIILLSALCFIISCQDQQAVNELQELKAQRELEKQNKTLVLKWVNDVNKDNFEQLFDDLWAENCMQYMNSDSEPIDYDHFKQMINNLYLEFPVIKHEVHDIIAQENKVIVRFSANLIHDTESFGVPATGKELKWMAIAIFEISEGKIQTRWEVADLLSMYEQLGVELRMKESE
jgi:steroid delta-isomerase-like uncharacterized protein